MGSTDRGGSVLRGVSALAVRLGLIPDSIAKFVEPGTACDPVLMRIGAEFPFTTLIRALKDPLKPRNSEIGFLSLDRAMI